MRPFAGFSLGLSASMFGCFSGACIWRRQMAEHSYQELPARWQCERVRHPSRRAHTRGISVGNIDAVSEDGTDFIRSDNHSRLQERRVVQAVQADLQRTAIQRARVFPTGRGRELHRVDRNAAVAQYHSSRVRSLPVA